MPPNHDLIAVAGDLAVCMEKSKSLIWFAENVFAISFEDFISGDHVHSALDRLDQHKKLLEVGGRTSFKSSRFYCEVMRDIFVGERNLEGNYYSYTKTLAQEHTGSIRKLIQANHFFDHITDTKPTSSYILQYQHPLGVYYELRPASLKSFKRGRHVDRMYIDDAFKDEAKKLRPKEIIKINEVVKKEMSPMLKPGALFRGIGTTQTNQDFYYDEAFTADKHVTISPAIIRGKGGRRRPLWPERYTMKELNAKLLEMGRGAFNQEFLCKPFYSTNTRIDEKDLMACIDPKLKMRRKYSGKNPVVGGYDLGKKRHPSFFCVFEVLPSGHYVELYLKWLHGVDYTDQLEMIEQWIDDFNIDVVYYDATRGEFDIMEEQDELPEEFEPVKFNAKTKEAMATMFDRHVTAGTITLLDDKDQTEQILAVDVDLEAVESTNEKGQVFHGDSMWGVGLAVMTPPEVITESDIHV